MQTTSLKPRHRRRWTLCPGWLLATYVALYTVLSGFGGWGQTASGKLRFHYADHVGFAMDDCFIWQPFAGDCQLFVNNSGENTLRGDGPGCFFAPLILFDQHFIHPTILFINPDGTGVASAKQPPLTDFHPLPGAHPFSGAPSPALKEPKTLTVTVLLTVVLLISFSVLPCIFPSLQKPNRRASCETRRS